jgi:hypothetical protein
MQVSQELSGVSADTFNSDAEVRISFTESVGEAMGVSNNSVQILGAKEIDANTTSRRLLSLRSSFLSQLRVRKLNDVRLNIDYSVIVVMQSLGFQDADEAVGHLKQSIEDSVSIGEFTDLLLSRNVKSLQNVSATGVSVTKVVFSYNSMSPTSQPTSQPSVPKKSSSDSNPGLSQGGFIGVIVAAGVLFLVLLGLVYYAFTTRSGHTLVHQHDQTGSKNAKHDGVVALPNQEPEEFMLGIEPEESSAPGVENVQFSDSRAMTKLPQDDLDDHVAHL